MIKDNATVVVQLFAMESRGLTVKVENVDNDSSNEKPREKQTRLNKVMFVCFLLFI